LKVSTDAHKEEQAMTIGEVMMFAQDFLRVALLISMPALITSLVVGLIVSILQTITSIQDQTMSFVPRVIAVGGVMLICLAWILQLTVQFTMQMFQHASEVVR
jgi:flagellar biosynthesis protein FliQ